MKYQGSNYLHVVTYENDDREEDMDKLAALVDKVTYLPFKYKSRVRMFFSKYPSSLINRKTPQMLKAIKDIMDTEEYDIVMANMLKYVKIDRSKTIIIPHVILEKGNQEKAIDYSSKLKIVHSGNLKAPRNPETFLKALHKFKNERGAIDLDVYVMGAFDDEMTEMIKELGLEENIKLITPMKNSESIEKLKEFDMALIIEAPCEGGIFLPTKVTDFIQEKIRIFTISPATGVLKDMYNKGMVEFFADVTNIDDIYENLSEIYDTFKQGNLKRIEQSDIYEFTEDAIVKQHLDF